MGKKIALLGILLALNQILLIFSSIFPTNKLFFLGIASLPISIVIIEKGVKNGALFYAASSLLAVILVPNKLYLIPYILFFGVYGLLKYLIEKDRSLIVEYILKIIIFNILFFIGYLIAKNLIFINFNHLIILGAQLVFLVYDYAYGLFINYYYKEIRRRIL